MIPSLSTTTTKLECTCTSTTKNLYIQYNTITVMPCIYRSSFFEVV